MDDNDLETKADLELANNLSLKIMQDAIEASGHDATIAVIALVLAASRSAGYSGIPLGALLGVFKTQYQMCDREAQEDLESLSKDVKSALSNSSIKKVN